jgi:UDP-N-acetylmuramate dehydrogenase
MDWQKNVSLRHRNTFGLDSQTRYFAVADSSEELRSHLRRAIEEERKTFILGGGSNVVLPRDFDGVTISLAMRGVKVDSDPDRSRLRVVVQSGENWHSLVRLCMGKGIFGLENLALIPGNVGAAPIQNIGAYGVEVSEFVDFVEAMEVKTGRVVKLTKEECGFGYRDSVFKRELAGSLVVTAVGLSLHTRPRLVLDYPDLGAELERMGVTKPLPADVCEAVIRVRRRKLPDPRFVGNAGSFFKNPIVSDDVLKRLQELHTDVPCFKSASECKLAAAWLIDQCGWKGRRCGPVGVWKHHALVIVNHGRATSDDVLRLAASIKESVVARFGIELSVEPTIV